MSDLSYICPFECIKEGNVCDCIYLFILTPLEPKSTGVNAFAITIVPLTI